MKRCITKTIGLIAFGISTSLIADGQSLIQTEKQKFSYTIGYQIGSQLVEQMKSGSIDIDQETFVQAIADAVAERSPLLTASEMEESLRAHQTTEEAKQVAAAESGRLRGKAFRDEYSRDKAVVVTESGLQYRIIEEGMGRSPGAADTVVVHYVGRLIDGSIFDSSRDRGNPATFSLGGIIAGWKEVLQLMVEGDVWEVVIPPELAYGAQGAGANIGPNETLVFEIELISIK